MHDILILGSGPAGLTAALYAARGGKNTIILGGDSLGGIMSTIHSLENYPGTPAINGFDLANIMKGQAEQFGAKIIPVSAEKISGEGPFSVRASDGNHYEAKTIIIATGTKPRPLGIEGAKEFTGRGVSYCATCDGFFSSGRDVLVIGGGNSALNEALYLANITKSVTIVYRKDSFARAEQVLIDRINNTENISVLFNTELQSVGGDESGVTYAITTKGDKLDVSAVFVAIGLEANTDYLDESVPRDNLGRLIPDKLPKGMFVAGDVYSGSKMQVATAVGTGCEAGMSAIAYVNSLK
jgi:thioredoxin reductase (NADPH)